MKNKPTDIDAILPHGEFIRGFANQAYVTKSDLNRFLKCRGIFSKYTDKETLVPILSTLLISPCEFDELREYQNTKEDNVKKSTSRIDCSPDLQLSQAIKDIDFEAIIPEEHTNYSLTSPPLIEFDRQNPDKVLIQFEIERIDLNKSWYESSNVFEGNISIEKTDENQLLMIKSYTSGESDSVANLIQNKTITHLKGRNEIGKDKKLAKVLFGDFNNEDRIVFFYRLSSYMNSDTFDFIDIVNVEISPDEGSNLPQEIVWMEKKTELKFKGSEIHKTFFVQEKQYHKYIKMWEMESAFKFKYLNFKGLCSVIFSFKEYLKKGDKAEFEINVSSFRLNDSSSHPPKERTDLKRKLLEIFDRKKEETYSNFLEHIRNEGR